MPRTSKADKPTYDEIKHFRSADEIDKAIEKLSRRVTEVQTLRGL